MIAKINSFRGIMTNSPLVIKNKNFSRPQTFHFPDRLQQETGSNWTRGSQIRSFFPPFAAGFGPANVLYRKAELAKDSAEPLLPGVLRRTAAPGRLGNFQALF